MKLYKYIVGFLAGSILFSCENFDEINTNPDSVTKVTPSLLATGAIMNVMSPSQKKNFINNQLVTKHIAWSEMIEETTQYNNFGREDFGGYTSLRNYQLMAQLADENTLMPEGQKNAYKGLALFLKAYRLFNYTLSVGDIPYDGILEGEQGHFTVAYNTQKEVFQRLLADLDQAHDYFQQASTFDGDPILGGDVDKWHRIANALELRVLTMLSKRADDADLNVKAKFAEVVNRGALLRSNSDNLQLVFSSKEGQLYPFHETLQSYKQYVMISTTVIDVLKEQQDYRLFYFAQPAPAKLAEGVAADSWDAYVGTDPSDRFDALTQQAGAGMSCMLNDRYTSYMPGEPLVYIGYAEQNFMLAEAALRGWIAEDASVYYKQGIEAHLKFISAYTPLEERYHHNRVITDDVIAATINNPMIQFTGDFEGDLYKIMQQKYLADFMQTPYLAYYDYRRTGYPEFPVNPETNRNSFAPDKMPMRWMYPKREFDYNKENVDNAVERQYGGSDDINQLMWILK